MVPTAFQRPYPKRVPSRKLQTRVPKAAHGHTVTQQTLAAVPLSIGGVLVKYMMPHSCTRTLCYSENEKAFLYMFVPVFGLFAPLKLPLVALLSVSQERPPTPAALPYQVPRSAGSCLCLADRRLWQCLRGSVSKSNSVCSELRSPDQGHVDPAFSRSQVPNSCLCPWLGRSELSAVAYPLVASPSSDFSGVLSPG